MKKTTIEKINIDNILDIMYEPRKNRYSVLEFNGTRKELSNKDFKTIELMLRLRAGIKPLDKRSNEWE